MSLLVVGLNHQTAPVEVRERLAFSGDRLPEALGSVKALPGLSETVLLSTCNRTEVYSRAETAEGMRAALTPWLQAFSPATPLGQHLYLHENQRAVEHLFRVAAGLDSMVVGEQEILSQVKNAYLAAQAAGSTGKLLNVFFQRSLYVGKRVRTETGLSTGAASVGSLAVSMAQRIFGDLSARRVMILGAGEMAKLIGRQLLSHKVQSVLVANRTPKHAQALAGYFGHRALSFEEGIDYIEQADIILCSTSAPEPVITRAQIESLMPRRRGRSLFFIDIAVPRNVHPDVHKIDNVYVYNIDDLQNLVRENLARRSDEVRRAEAIVREKTDEFRRWLAAYEAGEDHSLRHYAAQRPEPLGSLPGDY